MKSDQRKAGCVNEPSLLIPWPKVHLIGYRGVFASNSRWRKLVVPLPPPSAARTPPVPLGSSAPSVAPQPSNPERPDQARRLPWAALLKRVFGIDMLTCDRCGASCRIIAFIERPALARRILEHLGLPSTGPPRTGSRPRPQLDFLDARPSPFA